MNAPMSFPVAGRMSQLDGIWLRIANPQMIGRASSLADQIIFSATNFLLTLAIARLFSPTEFGIYGIALSLALFVQSFQKGFYVVPLSLAARPRITRSRAIRTGEHFIFFMLVEVVTIVLAAATMLLRLNSMIVETAITLVACCAIFLQSDFDRAILIKIRSTVSAAVASFAFCFAVVVSIACAHFLSLSFHAFIALLTALCLAKAILVMTMVGRLPSLRLGWLMLLRNFRSYGMPSLAGASIYAGMTQIPVMVLAAFRGPTEVAIFVAMRSLTQPLLVIVRSLDANDKNRFAERSGGTYEGMRRTFWRSFATYLAIGVAATIILTGFAPQITHLAFRHAFAVRVDLMAGWCAFCTLLALSMPVQSLTYQLGRQHSAMAWNIAGAALGLILSVALARSLGAIGTMIATVSGIFAMTCGGILAARDVALTRRTGPLPARGER